MKYTANMGLRKPEGGEYYSIEDFNANVDALDGAVTAKVNKPASFTLGNLTSVGAGGNLEDSGKNPYDFAGAAHNHDAAYAPKSHISDQSVHVGADEKAAIAAVESKADRVYVDSAFSTKANIFDPYKREVSESVLKSVIAYPGETIGYRGVNAPDAPPGQGRYWGKIVSIGCPKDYGLTVCFMRNDGGPIWLRSVMGTTWNENQWTPVATAIPTSEISVPLASGYTGWCLIKKNQFGDVSGELRVVSGNIQYNVPTVILPEGLRPNRTVYGCGITGNALGNAEGCEIAIRTNGEFVLWSNAPGAVLLTSHFMF